MEINNLQDAEYMDFLHNPLGYVFGEYFDITYFTVDDGVSMEINIEEKYEEDKGKRCQE